MADRPMTTMSTTDVIELLLADHEEAKSLLGRFDHTERTERAAKAVADHDRDVHGRRARQRLCDAVHFGELTLGEPAALLDDHVPQRSSRTADAREPDVHETQHEVPE